MERTVRQGVSHQGGRPPASLGVHRPVGRASHYSRDLRGMIIGVVGPYSAEALAQRNANLDAVNAAAARLLEIGHIRLIGMNAAIPVLVQANVPHRNKP